MKKVLVIVAFFFALGLTTLSAQDAVKPKKQQLGWTKPNMDEIGVSAEVQAKVEAIKKESDAEFKLVRENKELDPESRKKQNQALSIKRQKSISDLMTPEQLKKYNEIAARINAENKAMGQ